MKRIHISFTGLLMLAGSLGLQPFGASAAGPLAPPGAPAPMWKSLGEIEPRTLIDSVPYTISAPGSYYLSTNLTVTSGSAIMIATSGVNLDLNGFTLSSTAPSAAWNAAIAIGGGLRDIRISNGHIVSGVHHDEAGNYSGPGFGYGVDGSGAYTVMVNDVSVSGCLYYGINLSYNGGAVADCQVRTVGSYGIIAGVVTRCVADDCGAGAISGATVSQSWGYCGFGGSGISAQSALNCYGSSRDSYGVYAYTAENCYGQSSRDAGVWANTANNCYGNSYGTNSYGVVGADLRGCYGFGAYGGISAYDIASGCYGSASSGNGVYAPVAENCYGYSSSSVSNAYSNAGIAANVAHNCYGYSYNTSAGNYDRGLYAATANNCYGRAYNGYGIACWNTAENCYGASTYGYGIYATTANNCQGDSQNSIGLYATAANNCYGSGQTAEGLNATVANNCYGYSYNGAYGLYASSANNCYGNCYTSTGATGGSGLYAGRSAQNCIGYSNRPNGNGLYAYLAIGCYGADYSTGAYGVSAYIANSCGGDGPGATVAASYKYNMP